MSGEFDNWWLLDDPSEEVVRIVRELWGKQGEERVSLAEDSLALYLGSARHSLRGGGNPFALLDIMADAAVYNGIQAGVDTMVNATLKNIVRPMFITETADSETKRKTQAMQRAVDGVMYEQGLRGEKAMETCTAGYVFEGGGVEWFADTANSRVIATPVFCWEYFVSKREARHGNPRQLHSRHLIDRHVLLSYMKDAPKKIRDAIENAAAAPWRDTMDETRDTKRLSDQVVIYKSWHLPSGRVDLDNPKSWGKNEDGTRTVATNHDGRHVVALDGGDDGDHVAIVDAPWPHDMFPVAWFKPNHVPGSYWSRGEPEILAPAQIELNRWNSRVNQIVNLHAAPRTFVSKDSGLNPGQLNNNLSNIFLVKGNAASAVYVAAPSAIPPDIIRRLQDIPQWMRDQRGLSEMSMTARKPPGVNHEPGLAYLADTESQRHTAAFQAWERFNIDCAKNIIRCLNELAEYDPDYEVVFESDKMLTREKWTDIRLGDSYMVKTWPTNLLKQSPAERADQIADLIEKGVFPPEKYLDAIDAPDLGAIAGDRASMETNITRMLQRIVSSGDYTEKETPHPYMDLQLAKQIGIQRVNELQADESNNWKTINEVIRWLEDVDAAIQKGTPVAPPAGNNLGAAAPAGALPPPGPGGVPPPQGM